MTVAARNADYCATLVDEWVHQGLQHAFVSPGSRSAPLALALTRDGRVRVEVMLDERAAAFTALGAGRATGRPALVLCTSGTAATHFHAAVVEADSSAVPLLAVTADRPPELHGIGAPQTIDQANLYGRAVRAFLDPGPPDAQGPDSEAASRWRDLAADAYTKALGARRGPVHLNLAFREPLVGARGTVRGTPGPITAAAPRPTEDSDVERLASQVRGAERGVIVAGWGAGVPAPALERLARATGWPVLADPLSNARTRACEQAVHRYEALVRVPELASALRPDMVVRFGAALTSKVVTEWLAPVAPHVAIDPMGLGIDPTRSVTDRLVCDPECLIDTLLDDPPFDWRVAPSWAERWRALDRAAATAIDAQLDATGTPTGPRLARDIAAVLPAGAHAVVASSMPVRDFEWFAGALDGVVVHANRGANGIDGTIATATGVAIGSGAPTVAIMGDLAFLHDAGALLGLAAGEVALTLVVVDNGGGGIFSFLAQREHSPAGEFEQLFGTPQHADFVALAQAYAVEAVRVDGAAKVGPTVGASIEAGGVRVVVVPVLDRDADVVHHRELWAAVARAVSAGGGAATPPSATADR